MSRTSASESAGVRSPLELYLKEINHTALLRVEEERALAQRIKAGDPKARDLMVCANLRLVVSIAQHYTGKGVGLLDLIEEGNLGLMQAVDRFDPSRGLRFSTYATYWIKQAVRKALLSTSGTIRIPGYMAELAARWRRTAQRLQEEFGRVPSREEVAQRLQLSRRRVRLLEKALQVQGSRPQVNEIKTGVRLEDMLLEPHSVGIGQEIDPDELQQVLRLLETMKPRHALILRLRFGIATDRPQTLREIGEQLGLTSERVRQIESVALRKLSIRMHARTDR